MIHEVYRDNSIWITTFRQDKKSESHFVGAGKKQNKNYVDEKDVEQKRRQLIL